MKPRGSQRGCAPLLCLSPFLHKEKGAAGGTHARIRFISEMSTLSTTRNHYVSGNDPLSLARARESGKENTPRRGLLKKAVPSLDSPLLHMAVAEQIESKERSSQGARKKWFLHAGPAAAPCVIVDRNNKKSPSESGGGPQGGTGSPLKSRWRRQPITKAPQSFARLFNRRWRGSRSACSPLPRSSPGRRSPRSLRRAGAPLFNVRPAGTRPAGLRRQRRPVFDGSRLGRLVFSP
jgi:hypothetical protein